MPTIEADFLVETGCWLSKDGSEWGFYGRSAKGIRFQGYIACDSNCDHEEAAMMQAQSLLNDAIRKANRSQ